MAAVDFRMADELQDISKLKVADLKKELKVRGLSAVGNKTELVERLQLSLQGENSLITEPDSAAGDSEEIMDEDDVLADEEEEEVLVDISTSPEPKLGKLASASGNGSSIAIKPAVASSKKIVLNRNVVASTGSSEKENQQQHQTTQAIADTGRHQQHEQQSEGKKVIKLSAFSMKQRLEMRAQKFGVELSGDAKKEARAARFGISAPITTGNTGAASSDVMRKRAERFGVTLSSASGRNLSKVEINEKLEKRKQRFGTDDSTKAKKSTTSNSTLEAKKQLRAERFKLTK